MSPSRVSTDKSLESYRLHFRPASAQKWRFLEKTKIPCLERYSPLCTYGFKIDFGRKTREKKGFRERSRVAGSSVFRETMKIFCSDRYSPSQSSQKTFFSMIFLKKFYSIFRKYSKNSFLGKNFRHQTLFYIENGVFEFCQSLL